jgi:hypothetical protein
MAKALLKFESKYGPTVAAWTVVAIVVYLLITQ